MIAAGGADSRYPATSAPGPRPLAPFEIEGRTVASTFFEGLRARRDVVAFDQRGVDTSAGGETRCLATLAVPYAESFDALFKQCAAAYPSLEDRFWALYSQLAKAPITSNGAKIDGEALFELVAGRNYMATSGLARCARGFSRSTSRRSASGSARRNQPPAKQPKGSTRAFAFTARFCRPSCGGALIRD